MMEMAALADDRIKGEDRCLVLISLDEPQATEADLAATLSHGERKRAARFHRGRDRRRYIVAHARLRELLAQRLEVRPEQVSLGWTRFGKPELLGPQAMSGWHFSLSYSDGGDGGLAVCALSRRGRIGVDVESVRRLDDADALARHFFSPFEYRMYRQLSPWDRPLGFFRCWTRKEALVKALGTGLSQDLADFDVTLAPRAPARILRLGGMDGEGCGWHLDSIDLPGGRVAAVATERS